MEIIKSITYEEPFESLYRLNIGLSLDEYEAEEAMTKILKEDDIQKRISLLTILLNGIMIKGPSVNEVCGLLNASLKMDNIFDNPKRKIVLDNNELLVGVASSGKKGLKSINITTTACFIAAACGANIAKACSHSTSSKTGSSDFLSICGMDINIPFSKKEKILKENHIAFFSIENTTPKFADVYGGIFYAPHAMSFALAGLSIPVEVDSLAYGISHPNVKLSAEVLNKYGVKNALAYSSSLDGLHYLDEVLPSGIVNFCRINNGKIEKSISADIQDAFSINKRFDISSIKQSNDKIENVSRAINILRGNGSDEQNDAICINAAIFLLLAQKVDSLESGFWVAKEKLRTKEVWNLFLQVVEGYGGNLDKILKMI